MLRPWEALRERLGRPTHDRPAQQATGSTDPDRLPRAAEQQLAGLERRLLAVEAKVTRAKGWKDPLWWGVIVTGLIGVTSLAWQTKPWELFQGEKPKTVHLIDAHASAFAPNEWNADLRVVNGTSRDIVVERVTATFGRPRPGQSCHTGTTTRVLYPVSQLRAHSNLNLFQRIHPGEGAPFTGSPNIDRVFEPNQECPLSVAKLSSRHDTATFVVFMNSGARLRATAPLFYEPRARVGGGGFPPCVVVPIFPGC